MTETAAVIREARVPDKRLLVALAGAPGSGKSTVAAELVALLPDTALLPMDGFHLPQATLRELGRRDRMGAPDTFDVDGFVRIMTALRSPATFGSSGDVLLAPGFDRDIEESVPDAIHIGPEFSTVIVEGNYLLLDGENDTAGWGRVAPMFDLTFFIDVDDELRRERLVARHIRFGKTPEAAEAWTLGPDEANAVLIGATAPRADHSIRLG